MGTKLSEEELTGARVFEGKGRTLMSGMGTCRVPLFLYVIMDGSFHPKQLTQETMMFFIGESGVYSGAGALRTYDKGWSDAGQMFCEQILIVTRLRDADILESENRPQTLARRGSS